MRALACFLALAARSAATADEPAPPIGDGADEPVIVDVRGELLPRAGDASLPSVSIDRDALRSAGVSLAELLRDVPSVAVARTGGAADLTTASLRGGTSAQTPVYWGSVLLNDALTGTADLSAVPPMLLRRVDVYRGHAPIRVAGGLTGAIVLAPVVATDTYASLTTTLGGYGEHALDAALALGDGARGAAAFVRVAESAGNFDYVDDGGTAFDERDDVTRARVNADARSVDVWTTARAVARRAEVTVLLRNTAREQGVPGLGVLPAERAHASQRATFASLLGRVRADGAWTVDTSLRVRDGRSQLADPARELLLTGALTTVDATGVGGDLAFAFDAGPVTAGAGASLDTTALAVVSDRALVVRGRDLVSRAYVEVSTRPIDALDLRAEAAASTQTIRGREAGATATTSPDARLGAAVRPVAGVELFATAGVYHRAPLIGERLGVSATVLGNPDLTRELGGSADVGVRASADLDDVTLAAELTFFGRLAEDLIAYRRSSFGALKPFNVGSARVLGADALAEVRVARVVVAGGALTLTDARDTSDTTLANTSLPFVAPLTASPFVGVDASWTGVLRRAALKATLDVRAERVADPAGLVALPALFDLGVEGVLGFAPGELRVRGSNLAAQTATDLVGYPLPGPSVHVSLTTELR